MPGPSLLTRIRHPEYAVARRAVSDQEIRDSVVMHLRDMLGTRQGTMLTCADYGICDTSEFVHATHDDAIALLARTIRKTILQYEPRLASVVIKHVPGEATDVTLRFEIHATLQVGPQKLPIKLETSIDPSRRITLK